jgi:hypothetical protein
MGLGAVLGTVLSGVIRIMGMLMSGVFAPLMLLWLASLALVGWVWRVWPAWQMDWREANTAGRWLALFALGLAGAATFISWALLIP